MKKFRVWVSEETYGYYDIEAESEEEASDIYYEGTYTPSDMNFVWKNGSNEVQKIEEVKEEVK